ncbi:MAG: hypothetical protein ABSH12_05815 [Endomicrobiales bacterium]|jgi:hypothetical protein
MKSKIHLLFPFDLGLELDFTGEDALEFFKEIAVRSNEVISIDGKFIAEAEFSTQVYRFGVGIIQISFAVSGELNYLTHLSANVEKLYVATTPVISYCKSLVAGLIQKAMVYATYTYELRLTDDELFPIVEFSSPPAEDAAGFIRRQHRALFGMVSGELNYNRLSEFVLEKEKLVNYGYYENEIILIKRFGAAIFSPESHIIREMIKLAFAQYWSLRSYNFILDYELQTAQKLLAKLPPYYKFWKIPGAYQRFSSEATGFDRDKISIIDSLYNVIASVSRVDSDWHLRTLHTSVNTVFGIEELHKTVETKIEHITDSYNSAREFLSTNFFILLDIIFFLSLIWSILDTFLLWKLAIK